MAEDKQAGTEPKVPVERADLKAPGQPSPKGEDRPGFNLGGSADKDAQQGAVPDTGPISDPEIGNEQPTDRSQLTSKKGKPA
ncbi:hypothetical protein [Methylobacterium gregans]|uniref:Uncharacterized protein n=1 Tax=Methylobacterium gregans TaxID=374424 RepID=A0AA37MEB5_9HYPH|nr:hypothetical protein [Methylobacterium gregans]MDQ0523228.1 hypothetical protein [Methylobacterium gregans]GJD80611.1 hypothetical protein NBEOAGPD_3852 [Methylobacterium gregans]GLS53554.1 hypothetical protein GCM10007886_17370 [Methylobacterium gregans]